MKNICVWLIVMSCLLLADNTVFGKAKPADVIVGTLRVEQLDNPTGIDAVHPRLSWNISSAKQNVMQTAYHILVASSQDNLNKDIADMWDSGKVESSESLWIPYQGKTLRSNQRCYWKVKSFTSQGETPWSSVASWTMGLLSENDWSGQWVGCDKVMPWESEIKYSRLGARYLRKEFPVKKTVARATLHICGLGMYEAYINGQKVGDQVLSPAPTDYRKTVLYNSFDVTSLIKQNNAIGIALGNGRYFAMRQKYKTYKINTFGYPKMRLNLILDYTDGSKDIIASDTSWKLNVDGPIRSNNEYDGEIYDAIKELGTWTSAGYDDKNWENAERVGAPYGTLRAAMAPNMKVMKSVRPVSLLKTGDKYILDMGQNMAGWLKMNVRASKGDTIRLRFAETLKKDGTLYVENLREALAMDTYIANGQENGKPWNPTFVYHGFRYVEISGYRDAELSDFIGEVIYDGMQTTGSFSCDNETLNQVYKNACWGICDNYKGMPTDCPQRDERQPWLGDRVMGAWGESFVYGNGPFYAKWMNDIREAQREDGTIPDVAPAFWNYYTDNVTWPSAFWSVNDMLYTRYGNVSPIVKNYPAMRKWVEHIMTEYMDKDSIIGHDKYGDWCVPPESLELIHSKDPARITDGNLISTAYFIKILQTMGKFASLQNLTSEEQHWNTLERQFKDSFNKAFLHVKEGTSLVPQHVLYPDSTFYGNNTVTANLLPLAFNLVPEKYKENIVKQIVRTILIDNDGHVSCGVIGMQWLLKELCRAGRADVAYLLATNKTYPSWGYMAEQGATTTWELWNGNTANPAMNSGNHVMLLGDLLPFCYENLAGIRSATDNGEVAFRHIIMKPDFEIQNLGRVEASYESPYGLIKSRWSKMPSHLDWDVTIPCNTTAEIYLPNGRVEKVPSGSYHFSVEIPTSDKAILKDEFLYEKTSFPECHASTIVELPNGDLLAAFFGGTKERNPDCCIWTCRKTKGSAAWTAPRKVADGIYNDITKSAYNESDLKDGIKRKACWNPVLFQVPHGELLLFYKLGNNMPDWTGWLVRSRDNGKTWSVPEALPEGFLGPIKNKPEWIDGQILCPSSTEVNGWRAHMELTDSKCKHWKMIGPLDSELSVLTQFRKQKEAKAEAIYAIQPSILKLSDGRLQILCRTRNANISTAYSSDKGLTWSKMALMKNLPNNNSGIDAVTLQDGRHILIYNDFSSLDGTPKGPRNPLCVAISNDGQVWKKVLTLEDSPIKEYSYPAVIQGKDGEIHIVYTWRRQRIKHIVIDPGKIE